MKTRILTAIILIAIAIPFLYFSHTVAFNVVIALVAFVGAYEILNCTGQKNSALVSVPTYAISVLIPFMTRYAGSTERFFAISFIAVFVYLFWMFAVSAFCNAKINVKDSAITFAFTSYTVIGLSIIILFRDMDLGRYMYLLVFFYAWICDSFAYFTGRAIGKHKLIPSVSPKKTVEGAIGGIVFTALFSLLYGFVIGVFFDVTPNYLTLAVMGTVAAVVSQCGDLIASQIKRTYGIKDFGYIFPGHGGVLDRFDSVLAVAPFLYFLVEMLPLKAMFF